MLDAEPGGDGRRPRRRGAAPRRPIRQPADSPRLEELGQLNDLAYGTGDQLGKVIGEGEGDPEYVYVARESGQAVAGLLTADHRGDTSVWWVATAPEARGRGLASGLMRHALADGRERGNDISTLQATKLGRPVYESAGLPDLRRLRDVGAPRPLNRDYLGEGRWGYGAFVSGHSSCYLCATSRWGGARAGERARAAAPFARAFWAVVVLAYGALGVALLAT